MKMLGYGAGLRFPHLREVRDSDTRLLDWFEVISENFLAEHSPGRHHLREIAERYPVVMHGVSLSIGSCDPINYKYLAAIKKLASDIKARFITDHLCWTGVLGRNTHDLLPLPYTEEALVHVIKRVGIVQDFLEQPIALENPSSYVEFQDSQLHEADFLRILSEESGCSLLLDINNVYVSAFNHGFDPIDYLSRLNPASIVQYHLAGHTHKQTHILDTHVGPVPECVWALYEQALQRCGEKATLIEWDEDIPTFDELVEETLKARRLAQQVLKTKPSFYESPFSEA